MSLDLDNTLVECPRCGDKKEASAIWVWIDGQAEPLQLVDGVIEHSGRGRPDLFDLGCGCAFSTRLWALRAQAAVTLRRGPSLRVYIEPRIGIREIEGTS